VIAAAVVVVLDIVAAVVVPPVSEPGSPTELIRTFVRTNFEPIAPHVVFRIVPGSETFTISSTLLTEWLVMAVLIVLVWLVTRDLKPVPGRAQSVAEYVVDGFSGFVRSLGGPETQRYVPLFLALFLLIIASNWSGLLPGVGKIELFRAPTSDVNVTFGLALVSFVIFHVEGVRRLGFRGYLSKFFNFRGFRRSPFDGVVDLLVGLLEFLLEFFKPLTLALRLFANIYGGEIVLGVMTALLFAILPLPFLLLEAFVGFVQALVFAMLTVVFTLIAIEGHEEHEPAPHTAPATEPEAAPRPRPVPELKPTT
jgi:F-type H+-transporting ATPase subunit a